VGLLNFSGRSKIMSKVCAKFFSLHDLAEVGGDERVLQQHGGTPFVRRAMAAKRNSGNYIVCSCT